MSEIRVLDQGKYRANRWHLGELLKIVAPSYVDATAVLHRDAEHCDTLYLLYESDHLVAFFMVGWERDCGDRPGSPVGVFGPKRSSAGV
jgi:hypothetical protein